MSARAVRLFACGLAFALASSVALRRDEGAAVPVRIVPEAQARFGGIFRSVARAVGGVVRRVTSSVGKVVKSVGQNVVRGAKSVASGVGKIAKGAVQVVKGVGQIGAAVVKAGTKFTGGVLKAAGKAIKGDFKGALNEVKTSATSAGKTLVSGAKAGLGNVVAGAGKVVTGAIEATKGLAQLAMPFINIDVVIEKVKKVIVGVLMKIATGFMGKVAGKILGFDIGKILEIIATVKRAIEGVQQLVDIIKNPDEYLHKGREWAIDKLTDLVFQFFEPPLQKAVGFLAGMGLKLIKDMILAPLATAIGAAIAGIGIIATPLIWAAIRTLYDWAVDQLSEQLGKLAMAIPFLKDFLRGKIIAPIVNGVYDKIVSALRTKFPKIAGGLTTSKERAEAEGEAPEAPKPAGGFMAAVKGVVKSISLKKVVEAAKNAAPALAKVVVEAKKIGLPKLAPIEAARGIIGAAATKVVAEAKKLAAAAPALVPPLRLPSVRPPEAVLKAEGPRVEAETSVTLPDTPAEAPTVVPKPEAGLAGMRTAFRAVYALLVEDWKSGQQSGRVLGTAADQGLEGEVRDAVKQASALFSRRVHDAFRIVYSVRVLQLRELQRPQVEEALDQVSEVLSGEAGAKAAVEGGLDGFEGFAEAFEQAKFALQRFVQNGERFLKGSVVILQGRRQQLVKSVLAKFVRRIEEAKGALERVVAVIAEAVKAAQQAQAEEAGGEGEAPPAEGGGEGQ